MRKKPPINEFKSKPPDAKEVKKAIAMARRVSRKLVAMMTAKTKGQDA